jgi:hypothetical protein
MLNNIFEKVLHCLVIQPLIPPQEKIFKTLHMDKIIHARNRNASYYKLVYIHRLNFSEYQEDCRTRRGEMLNYYTRCNVSSD